MATNQHAIGTVFERCIEMIGNGKNLINPYPKLVSKEDFETVSEHAENAYNFLENYYGFIDFISWTGHATSSTSADLIINGEKVELKYLATAGAGTWLNTTANAIHEGYNFPKLYNWYLEKYGCYDMLEKKVGRHNFSRKNASPMNMKEASIFCKKNPDFVDEYSEKEIETRRIFVRDIVEHFECNPDKFDEFCNDIVTKTICAHKKKMPDLLFIYCHNSNDIITYNQEDMENLLGSRTMKYNDGDCQFTVGKFRNAWGWKNTCFCNPTLKVYLNS